MSDWQADALLLTASNSADDLEPTRQRALSYLAPFELDARVLYQVELVLEEAFMNVVLHAFPNGAPHTFEIRLQVTQEDVVLSLCDDGVAFDPLKRPPGVMPASIDEAEVGGLGLHLMRRNAKSIRYERVATQNHLQVVVARHPSQPQTPGYPR